MAYTENTFYRDWNCTKITEEPFVLEIVKTSFIYGIESYLLSGNACS